MEPDECLDCRVYGPLDCPHHGEWSSYGRDGLSMREVCAVCAILVGILVLAAIIVAT